MQQISVSDLGLDLDQVLQEFDFFGALSDDALVIVKERFELL